MTHYKNVKHAIYKVPNGKLLKVSLEEESGVLTSVSIRGDFFMHPEESLEMLERFLVGTKIDEDSLTARFTSFFSNNEVALFGIDIPSLVHTLTTAN